MTRVALLLLTLSLVLPASIQTPPSRNTIKIGAFLSLTGATAEYGISASNAIKLATDEVNRNGGIDGKMIELFIEDDHSNTEEVAGIVNKLIGVVKVAALIAEPVSTRAMVAAPIAQQHQVVMISIRLGEAGADDARRLYFSCLLHQLN